MLHVIAVMLTTRGSFVPRNYYNFPKEKTIWTWKCVVQITFSSWFLLKRRSWNLNWISLTTAKQIMWQEWQNKTINILWKLLAVNCKCAFFSPFICFLAVLFIFIIKSFLDPQRKEIVHNTFWSLTYLFQCMQGIHRVFCSHYLACSLFLSSGCYLLQTKYPVCVCSLCWH